MEQSLCPTLEEQQSSLKMYERAYARYVELRVFLSVCPASYLPSLKALKKLFQNWLQGSDAPGFDPPAFLYWSNWWLEAARRKKQEETDRRTKEAQTREDENRAAQQAQQRLRDFSRLPALQNDAFLCCQAYQRYLRGRRPKSFPRAPDEIVLDSHGFLEATNRLAETLRSKNSNLQAYDSQAARHRRKNGSL